MDGINELGGNGMSDSTLQQLLGQIMTGGGSDGGGGGRIGGGGGRMSSSSNNDNMGGEMGNLDLGSLGLNLGMGNGMGNRVGNKLGNGMGNGMDNGIEDLGGIGNSMGNGMGGMGNGMGGMGSMGNGMEGMGNGMGGAGMAMGMGGMGHGMKIGGIHIGGHAAGAMGSQADINTEVRGTFMLNDTIVQKSKEGECNKCPKCLITISDFVFPSLSAFMKLKSNGF